MAIASADYKFISVDVGQVGSASDGGVWENSQFGAAWKNGTELQYPTIYSIHIFDIHTIL